ncbi:RICIN domain-containing protein [Streptomyces sp. enrichment culture]|uniref:RICIN domain-containing protein n=1 Tax=Streptomyces sp. enrichment culture TaxID=1795815 RepID=UPI003F549290
MKLRRSPGLLGRLALLVGTLLTLVLGTAPASSADILWHPGPYRIVNSATGGNLVPWGLGVNHADNLLIYAWNDSAAGNSWRVEPVTADYYLIRNTITNKCIKAGSPYDTNVTFAVQYTCSQSYDFQWSFRGVPNSPTQFVIVSRSTSQALRPQYNLPNQVVILDTPSTSALSTWSLNPA